MHLGLYLKNVSAFFYFPHVFLVPASSEGVRSLFCRKCPARCGHFLVLFAYKSAAEVVESRSSGLSESTKTRVLNVCLHVTSKTLGSVRIC